MSVLDVDLSSASATNLPLELPAISHYLEEVMLGMRSPGQQRMQKQRVAGLKRVLKGPTRAAGTLRAGGQAAQTVCRWSFWIAFAVVFAGAPADLLGQLRGELAAGWHLLCLEVGRLPGERHVRDWVISALPFLFAQVVYRLLVDLFEADRKSLVQQGDAMLDKLSRVVHFEVTGFQLTTETIRRNRKRLLTLSVLRAPHLDQLEVAKEQRLQEALEGQPEKSYPLFSGRHDRAPLETSMLEHVMQARSKPLHHSAFYRHSSSFVTMGTRASLTSSHSHTCLPAPSELPRSSANMTTTGGDTPDSPGHAARQFGGNPTGSWATPIWRVPDALSVDRYDELSTNADDIFERQVEDLWRALPGETSSGSDLDDNEDSDEAPSSGQRPSSSPMLSRSSVSGFTIRIAGNSLPWPLPRRLPSSTATLVSAADSDRRRRRSSDASSEDIPTLQLPSSPKRKRSAKMLKQPAPSTAHEEKKQELAVERERREAAVQRKIVVEPLPEELCERELRTTWVSPVMERLAGPEQQERCLLRKNPAEAACLRVDSMVLKMETPPIPDHAQQLRQQAGGRARSAPNGATRKPGQQGQQGQQGQRVKSTPFAKGGPRSLLRQSDGTPPGGRSPKTPPGRGGGTFTGVKEGEVMDMPGYRQREEQKLVLQEPSMSLSTDVMRQRLREEGQAFHAATFSEYLKQVDIFTGDPKVRLDEKRLQNDETTTLAKAASLMGLPAFKQVRMHKLMARASGEASRARLRSR